MKQPSITEEPSKTNNRTYLEAAILAVILMVVIGLSFRLQAAPPPEVEMAGYSTSLQERTASQQHNARRAAAAIDGAVVPPGSTFSFNKTVKSWSMDRGYVRAPVSYDGDLIKAYGGGVCQTSTTLYNAALLAGLPILERHSHAFAPHYVPAGRDAAVAQYDIDLRFKNPYPWPIRIHASGGEERLHISILGAQMPKMFADVDSVVLASVTPQRLTRLVHGSAAYSNRPYLRNPGATGCRAITYRTFFSGGKEIRREQLGDDTYAAMNRVVQVAAE